jgi:hypothetical protein
MRPERSRASGRCTLERLRSSRGRRRVNDAKLGLKHLCRFLMAFK